MFGLKCCQEKACRMKKAFLLLKSLARFEFSICSKGTRLKRAMEKIRLYTTNIQLVGNAVRTRYVNRTYWDAKQLRIDAVSKPTEHLSSAPILPEGI